MKISDYIKNAHANIKKMPKKERFAYFLDYYKWHVVAIVLALALLVQGVVTICNRKEIVFYGVLLNCMIGVDDEAFLDGFYQHAGIDPDTQEAAFYTDLMLKDGNSKNDITAFQRIIAGIATKETDFVVGQEASFRLCAYNTSKLFVDLREFLDADTLAQLSGKLYYIDGAIVEQLSAEVGTEIDPNLMTSADPTKPETMTDPIPVGIDISDRQAFQSAYYFPDTVLYLGIVSNTPRPELCRQLIDYLWS
ncbi:MAG: hypothetical protein E7421_05770 [Ruminococcaceae bacterium]|nr:hypothetical protein [Oscillospiraceae bacterium]